jgi:hypothetical protein
VTFGCAWYRNLRGYAQNAARSPRFRPANAQLSYATYVNVLCDFCNGFGGISSVCFEVEGDL